MPTPPYVLRDRERLVQSYIREWQEGGPKERAQIESKLRTTLRYGNAQLKAEFMAHMPAELRRAMVGSAH